MDLTEFFEGGAFSADVTQCMGRAFEQACRTLRGGGHPDLIKEIIAKHIVRCARDGIRNPDQLCEAALAAIGLDAE
jgi:hypothetical protein